MQQIVRDGSISSWKIAFTWKTENLRCLECDWCWSLCKYCSRRHYFNRKRTWSYFEFELENAIIMFGDYNWIDCSIFSWWFSDRSNIFRNTRIGTIWRNNKYSIIFRWSDIKNKGKTKSYFFEFQWLEKC